MPNNTFNLILAENKWFNSVVSKNKKGEPTIDMERFLPNPTINIYEGRDLVKLDSNYLHKPTMKILLTPEAKETIKELDENEKFPYYEKLEKDYNLEKFGFKDRYDFNVKMWGSKWSTYEFKEESDNGEMQLCSFESAWSYYTKPLAVLSNYSTKPIINYSICEGSWFCTRRVFQAGKQVSFKEVRPSLVPNWIVEELVTKELFAKVVAWMGYKDFDEFLSQECGGDGTIDLVEIYRERLGSILKYVGKECEIGEALSFLERLFNLYTPIYSKVTLTCPITEGGDVIIDRNLLEEQLEVLDTMDLTLPRLTELTEVSKVLPREFYTSILEADKVKPFLAGNTLFIHLTIVNSYLLPKEITR